MISERQALSKIGLIGCVDTFSRVTVSRRRLDYELLTAELVSGVPSGHAMR